MRLIKNATFVTFAIVLMAGGDVLWAGSYQAIKPTYLTSDWANSIKVSVKGRAIFSGTANRNTYFIVTTSTNTLAWNAQNKKECWSPYGMVDSCVDIGEGHGLGYTGLHTDGKVIKCETSYCMGTLASPVLPCPTNNYYWGYVEVFRPATLQHYAYKEGNAVRIPCEGTDLDGGPFEPDPGCVGIIIDGKCCEDWIFWDDWVCLDDW